MGKNDRNQMHGRRKARDFAFKLIYEASVQKDKELSQLISDTEAAQEFATDSVLTEYIRSTVAGVMEKREEIDSVISESAHGWKLNRISATSGAILRLAIYEMLYSEDVPFIVAINEAVELAKKYDHEKAPKFINGILNAIAEKKGLKPAKEKTAEAETAPEAVEAEDKADE